MENEREEKEVNDKKEDIDPPQFINYPENFDNRTTRPCSLDDMPFFFEITTPDWQGLSKSSKDKLIHSGPFSLSRDPYI